MSKSTRHGSNSDEETPKTLPPARTRERQIGLMVNEAEKLVLKRMRDESASPTEVVAVLRLGTAREEADLERIKAQTAYLKAQQAKAESETVREEMFQKAMEAMSRYQGNRGA